MSTNSSPLNESVPVHVDELHSNRVETIEKRENLPADIPKGSIVILHAIPSNIGTEHYRTDPADLRDPPTFGIARSPGEAANSTIVDRGKVETNVLPEMEVNPTAYSFISEKGWFEAVTTSFHSMGIIDSMLDDELIVTLQGGLDCLERLAAQLPIYVYLTLVDVEGYRFEPAAMGYGYAPTHLPKRCALGPSSVTDYVNRPDTISSLMSRF
jgi:hypothetical protein